MSKEKLLREGPPRAKSPEEAFHSPGRTPVKGTEKAMEAIERGLKEEEEMKEDRRPSVPRLNLNIEPAKGLSGNSKGLSGNSKGLSGSPPRHREGNKKVDQERMLHASIMAKLTKADHTTSEEHRQIYLQAAIASACEYGDQGLVALIAKKLAETPRPGRSSTRARMRSGTGGKSISGRSKKAASRGIYLDVNEEHEMYTAPRLVPTPTPPTDVSYNGGSLGWTSSEPYPTEPLSRPGSRSGSYSRPASAASRPASRPVSAQTSRPGSRVDRQIMSSTWNPGEHRVTLHATGVTLTNRSRSPPTGRSRSPPTGRSRSPGTKGRRPASARPASAVTRNPNAKHTNKHRCLTRASNWKARPVSARERVPSHSSLKGAANIYSTPSSASQRANSPTREKLSDSSPYEIDPTWSKQQVENAKRLQRVYERYGYSPGDSAVLSIPRRGTKNIHATPEPPRPNHKLRRSASRMA